MPILMLFVCYPMKIDLIKPGELGKKICARKKTCVRSTLGMVSLASKLNSHILLHKTLNCVMNIIEMRADTNIHILES